MHLYHCMEEVEGRVQMGPFIFGFPIRDITHAINHKLTPRQ